MRILVLLMIFMSVATHAQSVRLCLTGDVMLDRGVRRFIEHRGAERLFRYTDSLFKAADFTLVNLECPVTADTLPQPKIYCFRAEPEWLAALGKAGITHCSMANNHSGDQGYAGVIATADNIMKYDMIPLGFREQGRRIIEPTLLTKNGTTIAVFASVLVGGHTDSTKRVIVHASATELSAAIRKWKLVHPSDRVLVFLHWGIEYHTSPEPSQQSGARALIDAGADAVIGHHPHVVQTVELYKNKPIIYSLGNFIFDQHDELTKSGLLTNLTFSSQGCVAEILPIQLEHYIPKIMHQEQAKQFITSVVERSSGIKCTQAGQMWILELSDK